MALRIIGCGNSDRGDDAAGVLVVRCLREFGVEALEQSGDSLSLMDEWLACDDVILVDATAPNGAPGQIRVWNALVDPLPADKLSCSTHGFGVREAVELARVLNRLPQSLLIYGIEGKHFSRDATLSPQVERAVESVAQQLLEAARTVVGVLQPVHGCT